MRGERSPLSEMEQRAREHGARRLNAIGIERSYREERQKLNLMNFEFYGAPCAVFLFMEGSLGRNMSKNRPLTWTWELRE